MVQILVMEAMWSLRERLQSHSPGLIQSAKNTMERVRRRQFQRDLKESRKS